MLVLESSPQNANWDPMSIKALQHRALRDTRWEMTKQTGIALIHCNIDSMYYGTTLQIVPTVPPAEAILSIRLICCNPYSFFTPMSSPLLIPLQIIFFLSNTGPGASKSNKPTAQTHICRIQLKNYYICT